MTNFNGQDPLVTTIDLSGNITIGGQLTAEGGILLPDGKDSAPSLAFILDTNTGLERSGTGEISFVSSGNKRLKVSPTAVTALVPLVGSSATFTNATVTTLTSTNATFTTATVTTLTSTNATFTNASATTLTSTLFTSSSDGSAAAPVFTFAGDTDVGIYLAASQSALAIAFEGALVASFNSSTVGVFANSFLISNPDSLTYFSMAPASGGTGLVTAFVNTTPVATLTTSSTTWATTQIGPTAQFTNSTFTNCTCTNLTSTAITTQTIQTDSIVAGLQPFGIWTFSSFTVAGATGATLPTTVTTVAYPTVALAPVGSAITYSAGTFTLQPGDYRVDVSEIWSNSSTPSSKTHRINFNGTSWQTCPPFVYPTSWNVNVFPFCLNTSSLLHAASPSTVTVDLQNDSVGVSWIIDLGRISIYKLG